MITKQVASKEQPIYTLKIFAFDYFQFSDAKILQEKHKIQLINAVDVPIQFNVNINFGFVDIEKLVQAKVFIKIVVIKGSEEIQLAELIIAFDYLIENFESFNKGGEKTFPMDFLQHLGNVSVSTSRGLVSAKLANTYLQNLIMPILHTDAKSIKRLAET